VNIVQVMLFQSVIVSNNLANSKGYFQQDQVRWMQINEDLYSNICNCLQGEAPHSSGRFKLILLLILVTIASAWWFYGSYLAYSIYWMVTTNCSKYVDSKMSEVLFLPDMHCDAVVFYLSIELQKVSWIVLSRWLPCALWSTSSSTSGSATPWRHVTRLTGQGGSCGRAPLASIGRRPQETTRKREGQL